MADTNRVLIYAEGAGVARDIKKALALYTKEGETGGDVFARNIWSRCTKK